MWAEIMGRLFVWQLSGNIEDFLEILGTFLHASISPYLSKLSRKPSSQDDSSESAQLNFHPATSPNPKNKLKIFPSYRA
jgi:hypothetical protein